MGAHGRSALHGVEGTDDARTPPGRRLAGFDGDESGCAWRTCRTPTRIPGPPRLGALVRMGRASGGVTAAVLADESSLVRRRAAELAASLADPDFLPLLSDEDAECRGGGVFCCRRTAGRPRRRRAVPSSPGSTPMRSAGSRPWPRLGAIGDAAGLAGDTGARWKTGRPCAGERSSPSPLSTVRS